jgi:hypothetical protein
VEKKPLGSKLDSCFTWQRTSDKPPFDDLLVGRGRTVPEGEIYGGGFSPDWRRFAAAMDDAVRIYDSRTGRCLAVIDIPATDAYVAGFSADGRKLWVIARDGVSIWFQRRPERWWGIVWTAQFWAAILLCSLFTLSLWRDRKYFKALDAKLAAKLAAKDAEKQADGGPGGASSGGR